MSGRGSRPGTTKRTGQGQSGQYRRWQAVQIRPKAAAYGSLLATNTAASVTSTWSGTRRSMPYRAVTQQTDAHLSAPGRTFAVHNLYANRTLS